MQQKKTQRLTQLFVLQIFSSFRCSVVPPSVLLVWQRPQPQPQPQPATHALPSACLARALSPAAERLAGDKHNAGCAFVVALFLRSFPAAALAFCARLCRKGRRAAPAQQEERKAGEAEMRASEERERGVASGRSFARLFFATECRAVRVRVCVYVCVCVSARVCRLLCYRRGREEEREKERMERRERDASFSFPSLSPPLFLRRPPHTAADGHLPCHSRSAPVYTFLCGLRGRLRGKRQAILRRRPWCPLHSPSSLSLLGD